MDMMIIHDAILNSSDPIIDGLRTTFNMMLAYIGSSWDEEDSINPMQFRIPVEQWARIAEMIKGATDKIDPKDTTTSLMIWMNKGPGSIR